MGVLISEEPYWKEEMALIIDVGTNGELVLGNAPASFLFLRDRPGFRRGPLRFGMRAAPGAIERVRLFTRRTGSEI